LCPLKLHENAVPTCGNSVFVLLGRIDGKFAVKTVFFRLFKKFFKKL